MADKRAAPTANDAPLPKRRKKAEDLSSNINTQKARSRQAKRSIGQAAYEKSVTAFKTQLKRKKKDWKDKHPGAGPQLEEAAYAQILAKIEADYRAKDKHPDQVAATYSYTPPSQFLRAIKPEPDWPEELIEEFDLDENDPEYATTLVEDVAADRAQFSGPWEKMKEFAESQAEQLITSNQQFLSSSHKKLISIKCDELIPTCPSDKLSEQFRQWKVAMDDIVVKLCSYIELLASDRQFRVQYSPEARNKEFMKQKLLFIYSSWKTVLIRNIETIYYKIKCMRHRPLWLSRAISIIANDSRLSRIGPGSLSLNMLLTDEEKRILRVLASTNIRNFRCWRDFFPDSVAKIKKARRRSFLRKRSTFRYHRRFFSQYASTNFRRVIGVPSICGMLQEILGFGYYAETRHIQDFTEFFDPTFSNIPGAADRVTFPLIHYLYEGIGDLPASRDIDLVVALLLLPDRAGVIPKFFVKNFRGNNAARFFI